MRFALKYGWKLIRNISLILILFVVSSCQSSSDYLRYWADHKEEYKQLIQYSDFLFKELAITDLNQHRIRTKTMKYISYKEIKTVYPNNSSDIYAIIERLKKLDADMGIGKGYNSFFIKSGGVLASDEWIVFCKQAIGFQAYTEDVKKLGYKVTFKQEVEKNWFYIVTD